MLLRVTEVKINQEVVFSPATRSDLELKQYYAEALRRLFDYSNHTGTRTMEVWMETPEGRIVGNSFTKLSDQFVQEVAETL